MIANSLAKFLRLYEESILRERIRTDLIDWASDVMGHSGLTPSAHHRFLLSNLDLVAKGEVKRVIVLMPPGSAKSTYVSIIFPIWWFIQHPATSVIAASHTAALVEHFSRRIQAIITENQNRIGFAIQADDRAAAHWRTDAGGEYYAVGVRGAVTGRRADLVIIDDPIKSMADADSPKCRQHLWDWYSAELMTRLKPDARIIVVMTRWHEQDLGGQLMTRGNEDWRLLRLPAIAEEGDQIDRPIGAPLWPAWESLEALVRKRAVVGSRVWSAMFQQAPKPPTESLFNIKMIEAIGSDRHINGSLLKTVRAWDLAATAASEQGDPDWTVGLKLSMYSDGYHVVEDIVRIRANYRTVQDMILSTACTDGHSVVVSLPIDPGQAGKYQTSLLSSRLSGYRVYVSRERGSKLTRAMIVATQMELGNLAVLQAPWNQALFDELSAYPQGTKDDQVDALSRALATISDISTKSKRLSLPYNVR